MDRSEKGELTVGQLRSYVTSAESALFEGIVERAAKGADRDRELERLNEGTGFAMPGASAS